jgi:hypothetical protein
MVEEKNEGNDLCIFYLAPFDTRLRRYSGR